MSGPPFNGLPLAEIAAEIERARRQVAEGSRLRKAALAYAKRGFLVFPIARRSKVPLGGLAPRGFRDASGDLATVEDWWTEAPHANIGIATGEASGFWVLDIDPRHGGEYSLEEIQGELGKLPETVTVETGSGGHHYWFACPPGGLRCRVSSWPGIDVKADGGYIVAPPSIHPNGQSYAFEDNLHPWGVEIAEAPGWLLAQVAVEKRSALTGHEWAEIMRPAKQGARNETLARVAGLLLRQVPLEVAVPLLRLYSEHLCEPPLSEAEACRTIQSILDAEARKVAANE